MVSRSVLVTVLILGIFSSQFVLQTEAIQDQLISLAVEKLFGLWKTETVDFVGHQCEYRTTPTIRKWQLKFKGRFWCPGLAPISGDSLASSRGSAIKEAISDFANQAVSRGIVDKQTVEIWLKNH